jgi:hypothetical protein
MGRGCQPLSGLPKAFYYDGFYFPFFFVSLCVPSWLKTGADLGALSFQFFKFLCRCIV